MLRLRSSQCPFMVALPGNFVSQTAGHRGLPTGRFFMWRASRMRPRTTKEIPVPKGKFLPDFTASGIDLSANMIVPKAARLIERGSILLGSDPSTYVFVKTDMQRNLFRIPLH